MKKFALILALLIALPTALSVELVAENRDMNAKDVFISGDYLYLISLANELYVFDITNLENPVLMSTYAFKQKINKIFVDGNYAYVASKERLQGFSILDVSDATAITELVNYNFNSTYGAYDIFVHGNYAYVVDYKTLKIFEITNKSNPILVSTIELGNGAGAVFVHGNYAYVTHKMSLSVIDISRKEEPEIVGTINKLSMLPKAIVYANDIIYIADDVNGLKIFDATDKTSPLLLTNFDSLDISSDIFVSNNYAYLADGKYGLKIYDVSNPRSVSLIESYDTPGSALSVYPKNSYVYVADSAGGLKILKTEIAKSIESVTSNLESTELTEEASRPLKEAQETNALADSESIDEVNEANQQVAVKQERADGSQASYEPLSPPMLTTYILLIVLVFFFAYYVLERISRQGTKLAKKSKRQKSSTKK